MAPFKQIDIITINVSDMTRSVQFYREILGFTVLKESPHRSVLALGENTKVALHRGVARKWEIDSHAAGISSLGFIVEDLEKTMEELKSRGATLLGPPSSRGASRVVELEDPDRFLITVSSPTSPMN